MKTHHLIAFLLLHVCLIACSPSSENNPKPKNLPLPQKTPPAPPPSQPASAPNSAVAEQILKQTASSENILTTARDAILNISASEIETIAEPADTEPNGEDDFFDDVQPPILASDVHLPPLCEQYFQRVDRCFKRTHSDSPNALRQMNQEARIALFQENPQPSDETCQALNKSFDGVANLLACE